MTKSNQLITLKEWDEMRYPNNTHHPNTLRKWAKEGYIQPTPIKHGKQYMVKRSAKYYDLVTGKTA